MPDPPVASRFTTRRERILWLLTTAVVIAIYSTLGLATTLAEELTNRELMDNISALGFLVVLAAVLLFGMRRRIPGAATIAIAGGATAVFVLVFLRMASPIERSHLIEYSLLAILIREALYERAAAGRPVPRPALLAVGLASLVGLLDELIQLIIPIRVFDPVDIGFNTLAATMGVVVSSVIGWGVGARNAIPPQRS